MRLDDCNRDCIMNSQSHFVARSGSRVRTLVLGKDGQNFAQKLGTPCFPVLVYELSIRYGQQSGFG